MESIAELANKWESAGVISQEEAELIFKSLDSYLEYEFEQIAIFIKKNDAEAGLCVLVKMTNFLSAAGSKVPGIITNLQKTIKKYQFHASMLGKKLGAKSLTISIGFPIGINISLTWDI
ncbi:hypothetical protein SAMN05216326_12711 [Nitrosomonas marina]|uniref:Uncharacterized protein n=1 Tax=Nitrosomonas marina TaxID=917 RepID=A0A1I0EGL0_9PROT|nr:hypothetical protein [Nitrosomonas marina]SET43970.1 hypothetical protein SAMN05216326_12711 [Nitrosomonas marina]